MSNTLYIMEAANLVCGDAGDNAAAGISTHFKIQELKLPALEENYVDHNAGGSPFAIEVPMYFNRLEAAFNLAGFEPDVMQMLARAEPVLHVFTAYGFIRDRMTNEALQAVAIMRGNLGRVNPTVFTRGNMFAHEYSIRAITHYELYFQYAENAQPSEIYFWDFFTSTRRVGGVDTWAQYNRILNTGAISSGPAVEPNAGPA